MSSHPSSDPEQAATVQRLRERFPEAIQETREHRGDLSVRLPREHLVAILTFLRDDPATRYEFLMDVAGVDWLGREPRFDVVYLLYSRTHNHRLRVHVGVPEDDPIVDTATGVWASANWAERECYDLFGLLFRGHPFLRRILTHDEFQGHALRKDYDQRQRWRCSKVSDLEGVVEVPPATESA